MDRRQFVTGLFAAGAAVTAPVTLAAGLIRPPRPPLILHTEVIKQPPVFVDPMFLEKPTGWTPVTIGEQCFLQHQTSLFLRGVGDTLDLDIRSYNMGHYQIALSTAGIDIKTFESRLLGGLIDWGEPIVAMITDVDQNNQFRVDFILDRPTPHGERLPLLGPIESKRGLSAQLAGQQGDVYRETADGWHPLRLLSGYLYSFTQFEKPTPLPAEKQYSLYNNTQIKIQKGLIPLNPARRHLWNIPHWPDLDMGVAVMTQQDEDFAYLGSYGRNYHQLLNRGERLEARIIRGGGSMPGEVIIDLSLVA